MKHSKTDLTELGNTIKLHLHIFNTSKNIGIKLQAPHPSKAAQKIEKKRPEQNFEKQFIDRVRLKYPHENTPSKYPTLRSHTTPPPLKRSSCLKKQKLGFSLRREK